MAITTRPNNTETTASNTTKPETTEPERGGRLWTRRLLRLVVGLMAVVALTALAGVPGR